jgi:hypothetical protein
MLKVVKNCYILFKVIYKQEKRNDKKGRPIPAGRAGSKD